MIFSKEYRINYYSKHFEKADFFVNKDMLEFNYDKICVGNYNDFKKNETSITYFRDMSRHLSQLNNYHTNYLFYRFGDHFTRCKYPTFVKTRHKDDVNSNIILLNLDQEYHTSMLTGIPNMDTPFNEKNNKLLWRGCSTGEHIHGMRNLIVKKFQYSSNPDIDIKYNKLVQGVTNNNNEFILAEGKSIQEMLKSKFLISIEGNDVASNLKWILLSNSVALMPIPKVCSWFMEDHLEPFVHFVPLNDNFDDLEEKYQWCLDNLDECEKISKNATEYILQFMNEENEREIVNTLITNYMNCINITVEP
jgi:hypothetical protein